MAWSTPRAAGALLLIAAGCAPPAETRAYRADLDAFARTAPPAAVAADPGGDAVFAGEATLDRAALVRAVLDRNPGVAAARAAWRAALAQVPQTTALADPMLSYSVAPLSLASDAPFGQRVALAERLPVPGRRALAAQVALAEADAARGAVDTTRLDLAVMASTLYDDYYVATRALAINDAHRALVVELERVARARYAAGTGAAQDALEAEAELARLDHDKRGPRRRPCRRRRRHERPAPPRPRPRPAAAARRAGPAAGHRRRRRRARGRGGARPSRARDPPRRGPRRRRRGLAGPARRLSGALGHGRLRLDAAHACAPLDVGVAIDLPFGRATRRAAVEQAVATGERAARGYDGDVDRVRVEVATTAPAPTRRATWSGSTTSSSSRSPATGSPSRGPGWRPARPASPR